MPIQTTIFSNWHHRKISFKFENVFNMLRVLCDDRLCAVVKVAGFKYFYHEVSICSFSVLML